MRINLETSNTGETRSFQMGIAILMALGMCATSMPADAIAAMLWERFSAGITSAIDLSDDSNERCESHLKPG
jgi:hypothetical protein